MRTNHGAFHLFSDSVPEKVNSVKNNSADDDKSKKIPSMQRGKLYTFPKKRLTIHNT